MGLILIKKKDFFVNNYFSKIFVFLISILFFSTFIFEDNKFYAKKFEKTKFNYDNINFKSPKILDYLLIDKGNIFIWGWHPQLYVLSYLYPSDRATITQKYIGAIGEKDQVNAFSNIKYFNNRLVNDIK